MNEQGRRLVVREARPRDAGRGIARLPAAVRERLGVHSGDAVLVEGAEVTAAKVWPGADDLPADAVRIDGETRANAGVGLGDEVSVSAASLPDAERVALGVEDGVDGDDVRDALRDRPVAAGERVRVAGPGETRECAVLSTAPEGPVVVTDATEFDLDPDGGDGARVGTTYEDVGGLGEELGLVRELVELPLSEPDRFADLGIEPPKGVLLHGPPGTGKTLLARAVANEADAHFLSVSGPEIVRKYAGESEERLREVFAEARERAPSIVFFDEIDSVAAAREDEADMESRVVAQLLSLMDGLDSRGEVIVVGATNRLDAIDPALRRPGRFDREIEVGVPDHEGRVEILRIHARGTPLADGVDLDAVAGRTHGFVGADLRALVTEAAMIALRRGAADDPAVTPADFERALSAVDPSAMRAHVAESPAVDFGDVGGLGDAKALLREAVQWPLERPALFEATATDPPSGVLLHGPPGTGKTLLARAVAGESEVNFVRVAGPELLDRYVGESEAAVRDVFERARRAAPTVLFFDEVDAVAGRRSEDGTGERVVSQLLTEFDAAASNPNLVVVAATNRPDALDPALRRPGRLEAEIEVPPPDADARREILAVHARGKPLADGVDLDAVAARTEGATGAELRALLRRASMHAIREVAERHGVADADPTAVAIESRHVEAALAER